MFAVGVQYEGCAIEDQFVLPANEIAIGHGHARIGDAGRAVLS